MFEAKEFTEAFKTVCEVMRQGAASHPADEWRSLPHEFHVGRAIEHLRQWQADDQQQNHLSHGPRGCWQYLAHYANSLRMPLRCDQQGMGYTTLTTGRLDQPDSQTWKFTVRCRSFAGCANATPYLSAP